MEIRGGALHDQFVVDVIQGGAGTSTNMNANEVIANRALEILGDAPRRLRQVASTRTRQSQPEHERRLSHGDQSRSASAHRHPARHDAGGRRGVRRQGRGIRLGVEDGPHPTAGRGPDDAGPGIRHLRHHGQPRTPNVCRRPRSWSPRSTWAARRSAPDSTRIRCTPGWCAKSSGRSPVSRWPPRTIWWRPPRMSAPSSNCPVSSNAPREAVQDLQRPPAVVLGT